MTCENWINLIAAILVGGGTLALAFMTWKSIRQTQTIHGAERKDRLLSEIIEWTTELSNFNIAPPSDLRDIKDLEVIYRWSAPRWANFLSSKESIGKSLKRRAEVMWPNMGGFIEEVLKNIKLTALAMDYPKSSLSPDEVLKIIHKVGDCASELDNSVEKVTEEVDKIKTRDIG